MADDDDGFVAAARMRMEKSVCHERDPANGHQRFRNARRGAPEAGADAGGENDGLGDGRHNGHLNTKDIGARFARHVARHVTFMLHFPAWPTHPIPRAGEPRRV
jgi:hypothetical protein